MRERRSELDELLACSTEVHRKQQLLPQEKVRFQPSCSVFLLLVARRHGMEFHKGVPQGSSLGPLLLFIKGSLSGNLATSPRSCFTNYNL